MTKEIIILTCSASNYRAQDLLQLRFLNDINYLLSLGGTIISISEEVRNKKAYITLDTDVLNDLKLTNFDELKGRVIY